MVNLILKVDLSKSDVKEQFDKLVQEFENSLSLCYLFEQLVLEKIANINISENELETPVVRILKPIKREI